MARGLVYERGEVQVQSLRHRAPLLQQLFEHGQAGGLDLDNIPRRPHQLAEQRHEPRTQVGLTTLLSSRSGAGDVPADLEN